MNNDTTVASNDESRKKSTNNEVTNTNDIKVNYMSDEEVRKDIEEWDEEKKGIYVAAIDTEFIENLISQESSASSATSGETGRRKRIKVSSKIALPLSYLINNPLITIGAKEEKGKFKIARQKAKLAKKSQEIKQQDQEK